MVILENMITNRLLKWTFKHQKSENTVVIYSDAFTKVNICGIIISVGNSTNSILSVSYGKHNTNFYLNYYNFRGRRMARQLIKEDLEDDI